MSWKHSCEDEDFVQDEEEILSWKDICQDWNKNGSNDFAIKMDGDGDGDGDDEMNEFQMGGPNQLQEGNLDSYNGRASFRIDATGRIAGTNYPHVISTKVARRFPKSSGGLSRCKDSTGNPFAVPPAESPNKGGGGNSNNDGGAQNQLQQFQRDRKHEEFLDQFEKLLQSPEGLFLIRNATAPTGTCATDCHYQPGNTGLYPPVNAIEVAAATEAHKAKFFPQDAYSIMALNGPTAEEGWPRQRLLFFLFGFMACAFQFALIGLLLSHLDFKHSLENDPSGASGASDTPEKENQIVGEGEEDNLVKAAQVVSLLVYMVFPGSTQQDLIKAIMLFPWCAPKAETIPIGCIRTSCILRGIQGYNALSVVFLLIMQSDNALDIILNFTAVNFISDLDDAAFSLAKSGIFGHGLQQETARIANTMLPKCIYRESKHIWYTTVMVCSGATLLSAMIFMTVAEKNNYFLDCIARGIAGAIGLLLILLSIAWSSCSVCYHWCAGSKNHGSSSTNTEADIEAAIPEGKCVRSSVQTERTTSTHQSLEFIQELPDV